MNIENFPTSESAKRMMSYITGNGFYDRSYVGKWIFQVMGIEMDEARRIIVDEFPLQAFPETATWGLRYHEEKFGLPVRENLSYEQRRSLILERRDAKAPITPWRMETMVRNVIGCDVRVVDIHEPDNRLTHPNTFIVYLEGEGEFSLQKGIDRINDIKQSHTCYELHIRIAVFVLVENILFNRTTIRLPITWWGATWDGEYNFDGSIFFNARQPPYFSMMVPIEVPNELNLDFIRLAHRLPQISEYGELSLKMSHRIPINWWGASFDGEYLFDGGILFNAVRPPYFFVGYNSDIENEEQVHFEHAEISAFVSKNDNAVKVRDVHRADFLWPDFVKTFDGQLSFDGEETFSQESPPKFSCITHRMEAEHREDFGVMLYIPSNAALFNGSASFDGSKHFNSGREDL